MCLVDGNNGQIGAIKRDAKTRKLKVTIVIDYLHVMDPRHLMRVDVPSEEPHPIQSRQPTDRTARRCAANAP